MAKILVIDDSVTIRAQLKKDLVEAGHEVLEAEDGLIGIEVIRENTDIQVIFCDVNMPNLDGLSMAELVSDQELTGANILMLTTESNPELKERGRQAGIKAWITKPYSKAKVIKAIEKLVA